MWQGKEDSPELEQGRAVFSSQLAHKGMGLQLKLCYMVWCCVLLGRVHSATAALLCLYIPHQINYKDVLKHCLFSPPKKDVKNLVFSMNLSLV